MIDDILNKEVGVSVREKMNQSFEKINNTLPNKVDKVLTATQGNVPVFGENGVLLDSGQQPGGGDESNIPEYSESIPYDEGFVTRYENRLWASKVNGNLGNIPPITTGEDAFWIETAANQTTSTPLWSAGTYTADRSEVYRLTDKYRKYVLTAAAPFTSVDFDAELSNGDWQIIAGDINPIRFFCSDNNSDLTTDNRGFQYAQQNQTISSIFLVVETAPTGTGILMDILKNGTSIISSSATISAGANSVTITEPQITDIAIASGDKMEVQVTSVGLITAGAGLSAYFNTILT